MTLSLLVFTFGCSAAVTTPECSRITSACLSTASMDLGSARCLALAVQKDEGMCAMMRPGCEFICINGAPVDAAPIDSSVPDSGVVDAALPDAGGDTGTVTPPPVSVPMLIGVGEGQSFRPWTSGQHVRGVAGGQGGVMLVPTIRIPVSEFPLDASPQLSGNLRIHFIGTTMNNPYDFFGGFDSSTVQVEFARVGDFYEASGIFAQYGDQTDNAPAFEVHTVWVLNLSGAVEGEAYRFISTLDLTIDP